MKEITSEVAELFQRDGSTLVRKTKLSTNSMNELVESVLCGGENDEQ